LRAAQHRRAPPEEDKKIFSQIPRPAALFKLSLRACPDKSATEQDIWRNVMIWNWMLMIDVWLVGLWVVVMGVVCQVSGDLITQERRPAHFSGDARILRLAPATIRHACFRAIPGNMIPVHRLGWEDIMSIANSVGGTETSGNPYIKGPVPNAIQ
jgi:hypothetical protein